MKKLIAMLVTVLCAAPALLAQETVSGVVVDKKGNPLPGVKIEIPGSQDWTVSDLDGTFTITRPNYYVKKLSAQYAGMGSRKVKIKDGMRIKMKEEKMWKRVPDKWSTFIEAIVGVPNSPVSDLSDNLAYGLMIGRVKQFGYYVKGMTNTFGVSDKGEWSRDTQGFIDKQKATYWSVTGGGMVRLGCPLHLYLGLGYADYHYYLRDLSGDWYSYPDGTVTGMVIDMGLMFKIKRVTLSLGLINGNILLQEKFHKTHANFCGNLGIGYSF